MSSFGTTPQSFSPTVNTSLAGISPYSSTPTQQTGFLGSGLANVNQVATGQTKPGIRAANLQGWGDVVGTDARYAEPNVGLAAPNQQQINNVVMDRYQNNPAAMAARGLQTLGQFGGMINPAAALAAPLGSAIDYGVRQSYGIPSNTTGLAGTLGGFLGSQLGLGPAGAILGSSTGQALASETPGETFGRGMFGGIARLAGGLLGGELGGQVGSTLGGTALGNLAKMAMAYQGMKNQQQQTRDINTAQGRQTQYANQLANLVNNPNSFQNSALFKAQREQALREGLRGLAAQGKLGSGARAYAMGNVASNVANQYYNQEANRLASLAGNSAQQVELARARANAQGAQNYQLMQLASQYLS
jgi:hypothetical protein